MRSLGLDEARAPTRGLGSPWEAEGSRPRALTGTGPAGALVAASSLQVREGVSVSQPPADGIWSRQPEPPMAAWRAPSRGAEPPRASGIKGAPGRKPAQIRRQSLKRSLEGFSDEDFIFQNQLAPCCRSPLVHTVELTVAWRLRAHRPRHKPQVFGGQSGHVFLPTSVTLRPFDGAV